jgi:Rrf2 family iron-sulfur cluster assembly transcriptional regulator
VLKKDAFSKTRLPGVIWNSSSSIRVACTGGGEVRISKAEEYGVRLAMRLATAGHQLTIRELAGLEGIPEPTVAKVISRLRRSGTVIAERGRHGGYALARRPGDITVAGILAAMDDRVYDSGFCQRMSPGNGACTHLADCTLRPVWRDLTALVGRFLEGITVADLIDDRRPRLDRPVRLPSTAEGGA